MDKKIALMALMKREKYVQNKLAKLIIFNAAMVDASRRTRRAMENEIAWTTVMKQNHYVRKIQL
jgi:hypothetical protein